MVWITWVKFVLCVLVILFFGSRVARYGDIIARRTGLGHVFVGVLLLSIVTSLPELFTGISAVTLVPMPSIS